jgi:hypothetical protein
MRAIIRKRIFHHSAESILLQLMREAFWRARRD